MKTNILINHTVLTFVAAAFSLCATTYGDDATVKWSDKSFIQSAYKDGLAEVKMAELGQKKAANSEVKSFADQIATDHGKLNADLKALADSKKVDVATEPSMMDQGKMKLLDRKTGAEFDKVFAKAMVDDHKSAVKAFEKASSDAKDGDVKALATKALPTLKMHLSTAEGLRDKVGR